MRREQQIQPEPEIETQLHPALQESEEVKKPLQQWELLAMKEKAQELRELKEGYKDPERFAKQLKKLLPAEVKNDQAYKAAVLGKSGAQLLELVNQIINKFDSVPVPSPVEVETKKPTMQKVLSEVFKYVPDRIRQTLKSARAIKRNKDDIRSSFEDILQDPAVPENLRRDWEKAQRSLASPEVVAALENAEAEYNRKKQIEKQKAKQTGEPQLEQRDPKEPFAEISKDSFMEMVRQRNKQPIKKTQDVVPPAKPEIVPVKVEPPKDFPVQEAAPKVEYSFPQRIEAAMKELIPLFEADPQEFVQSLKIYEKEKDFKRGAEDLVEAFYRHYGAGELFNEKKKTVAEWTSEKTGVHLRRAQVMLLDLARALHSFNEEELDVKKPEKKLEKTVKEPVKVEQPPAVPKKIMDNPFVKTKTESKDKLSQYETHPEILRLIDVAKKDILRQLNSEKLKESNFLKESNPEFKSVFETFWKLNKKEIIEYALNKGILE